MSFPINLNTAHKLASNHSSTIPFYSVLLTIEVTVNNQILTLSVDTGAGLLLINHVYAKDLPRVKQDRYVIQAFKGKALTNYGFTIVPLTIGNRYVEYPMLIVKGCHCPILLGFDFIESYGYVIDTKQSHMQSDHLGLTNFANPKRNMLSTLPTDVRANLDFSDDPSPRINVKNVADIENIPVMPTIVIHTAVPEYRELSVPAHIPVDHNDCEELTSVPAIN